MYFYLYVFIISIRGIASSVAYIGNFIQVNLKLKRNKRAVGWGLSEMNGWNG